MIPQRAGQLGFGDRLSCAAADASDAKQRRSGGELVTSHLFGGQRQDRAKQTVLRLADGKLRGMNSDCEAACASSEIVATQAPLSPLLQPPFRSQGQGQRRKHEATTKSLSD